MTPHLGGRLADAAAFHGLGGVAHGGASGLSSAFKALTRAGTGAFVSSTPIRLFTSSTWDAPLETVPRRVCMPGYWRSGSRRGSAA